jgi:hypothetical protein
MGEQVTVQELRDYWTYIDELKPGQAIERYIETSAMPSWDQICQQLDWDHYKLNDGYFSRKDHGFCGVYILFGLETEKRLAPATINRNCGQDQNGTLYIGEAGWLNQRLNQMRRSLRGEDTHGASRMWRQSAILNSRFPSNKLGVAILLTRVSMHPWIERDLIRAYLNSFGDTPPLNCSF